MDSLDLFAVRRFPFLTRRNYVTELYHLLLWGVVIGAVEGGVAAVVAAKTFGGGPLLITAITATPFSAHLTSLFWGMLSVGRRKIKVMSLCALAAVAVVAGIGLTPRGSFGAWLFLAQVAIGQVFLSAVVTVRTALWKSNYDRSVRAQITARLLLIRGASAVATALFAGAIFDADPGAYRWFYPLVAAVGLGAVLMLQRMRTRGEKAELLRIRGGSPDAADPGWPPVFGITTVFSPGHLLSEMYRVLRTDGPFARYCGAQMLLGIANIMSIPVTAIIITQELELGYIAGTALLFATPQLVSMFSKLHWAKLFDRVGVLEFRVTSGMFWSAAFILGGIGTLFMLGNHAPGTRAHVWAVVLFAGSLVCRGMGLGGGELAWNLGHLHFADPHRAEVYMGVHVTLTGVRGLVVPFFGTFFYHSLGWWFWLIALALNGLSIYVFSSLAKLKHGKGEKVGEVDASHPIYKSEFDESPSR